MTESMYNINPTQLGQTIITLHYIKQMLGHSTLEDTLHDYIHEEGLTDNGVKECVRFIKNEFTRGKMRKGSYEE